MNPNEPPENIVERLQQCLPFTVLKRGAICTISKGLQLQQCLPFTVLKLIILCIHVMIFLSLVATVLTVYGIETQLHLQHRFYSICCNSAYRLRY